MIDSPTDAIALLIVGLVGYLVGSISSGYIVGRIYRNVDLRKVSEHPKSGSSRPGLLRKIDNRTLNFSGHERTQTSGRISYL